MSIDRLRRDVNLLSSEDRSQRKGALNQLLTLCNSLSVEKNPDEVAAVCSELMRPTLKALGDKVEQCRALAVKLLDKVVSYEDEDKYIDGILQAIVSRIGTEPVQEESEDVRLDLVNLAIKIAETYPHEIEIRNLIEYYKSILEQCFQDAFPDLKRACAKCVMVLCKVAPRHIKHVAINLIKYVKPNLRHKHSVVRKDMVLAFSELILNGAQEILADSRDLPEHQSTIYTLNLMINDQADGVRATLLAAYGRWLTELKERGDHHFRLLPMILLCVTDPITAIRDQAIAILEEVGRYYMLDNEDNAPVDSIDKRRVTLKDIMWYSESAYPDMTKFDCQSSFSQPTARPSLGARMAVAESVRRWIPDVCKQLLDIDWCIPISKVTRRIAAIRMLQSTLRYIENNAVQYLQSLLDVMYKTINDEDKVVRQEMRFAAELLGKFIAPQHYIPLIVPNAEARAKQQKDQDAEIVTAGNAKGAASSTRFPTWFSASTPLIRGGVILVFDLLLKGSREYITSDEVGCILQAFNTEELIDFDQPTLVAALVALIEDLLRIAEHRGMLGTFEFGFFCCLLTMHSANEPEVRAKAQSLITTLSQCTTGSEFGVYGKHFRSVLKSSTAANASVLDNLLRNSGRAQAEHVTEIVELFCCRLSEIQYTVNTNQNLRLFVLLNYFLTNSFQNGITFTEQHLEPLLRGVILPHAEWSRGQVAVQFRRAALAALTSLLSSGVLNAILFRSPEQNPQLLSKLGMVVLNCFDTDDADVRMAAVRMTPLVLQTPLAPDQTKSLITDHVKKLDDARDTIRLATAHSLKTVYELVKFTAIRHVSVTSVLMDLAVFRSVVHDTLVHMDDMSEDIQQAAYEALLQMLKAGGPPHVEVLREEVVRVRSKHATTRYCDGLLAEMN